MRSALASACALVVLGCGRESAEESRGTSPAIDAPFVSSADLVVEGTSLRTLDASDMVSQLQSMDAFYASEPPESAAEAASPAEGSCVSSMLGTIRMSLAGALLRGGSTLDLSSCFNTPAVTAFFSDVTMRVDGRFYFEIGCQGADLTPFDGKTLAELSDGPSSLGRLDCAEASLLSNGIYDVYFAATTTLGGKSQRIEQNDVSTHYAGRSEARPCTKSLSDGAYTHADGCLDISRTLSKVSRLDGNPDAFEGTTDLIRLESEGLKDARAPAPAFYAAGRYLVQINDWSGEMTYSSISDAPVWVMTSGQQSLTGIFDGKGWGGFALAGRLRIPQPRLRWSRRL